MFEQVREVIVRTLQCEEALVVPTASLREDLHADSLDAVELIMALEEAFGITVEEDAAQQIATVAALVELVEKARA